ncbi:uncharacterized protein STEHIDRAFT_169692 [Stereum hirsutum FP-91666 SS1]|uniref:uncharacterized protein n=1 Tax=Stereum hirsutum (strain FP-91666) TaxID=721885 RepID=UPI0004449280|nr:uncharacterized protein STEHIDRAFT_169692 [Stereum hirsutum FP-91666 SS1]EIM84797.1 hypothetical protein STEHIDRAFT_169692 [Stereum hirsutum FP-91666 SS1]
MTSNPNDIKGELCLFAKIHPKAGMGPQVVEWIGKLKDAVKNEPGTLEYSWAQNGDELLVWERYVDAAAFAAHTTNDVFKAFVAADLWRSAPSMTFYSGEVKGDF